jgi:hypothetical protein
MINMRDTQYGSYNPYANVAAQKAGVSFDPYSAQTAQTGYNPMQGTTLGQEYSFQMPDVWQQAIDTYSRIASGAGGGGRGGGGVGGAGKLDIGAVDVAGLMDVLRPQAERGLQEFTAQSMEQADLGGTRWSTPLQARLTQEGQRLAENLSVQQMQAEIAAQEAYKQRVIQQAQINAQRAAASAGARAAQLQAQMQAAGGLMQAGWLPMELGERMSGLGQGMFSSQMQQAQMMNQMNPYLQNILGMASGTGFAPTQYGPSAFGTGLDVFSSMYPMLQGMQPQTTTTLGQTPLPSPRSFSGFTM